MTATRIAKASTLVALAAAWLVAAWLLGGRPFRATSTRRTSMPRAVLPGRACCTGARATTASCAGSGWPRPSSRWRRSRCSPHFGPRLARAWELGRVATGVMVGAVTTLGVWAVGLPFGAVQLWWGRRYGLEQQSYLEWVLEQWPALHRPGRRPDDRADGSDAARRALRPALVARRGAAVRRWPASCSCSCCRGSRRSARVRRITPRSRLASGSWRARRASATRRSGSRTSTARRRRERDVDRDRPVGAGLHLGHVPRRALLRPRDRGGRRARVRPRRAPAHLEGARLVAAADGPRLLLVERATRRRGGLARPEVVPARAARARADRPRDDAASATRSRAATRRRPTGRRCGRRTTRPRPRGFRKFTRYDLVQPNPPLWSYVWIDDHPTLVQRIAMARA